MRLTPHCTLEHVTVTIHSGTRDQLLMLTGISFIKFESGERNTHRTLRTYEHYTNNPVKHLYVKNPWPSGECPGLESLTSRMWGECSTNWAAWPAWIYQAVPCIYSGIKVMVQKSTNAFKQVKDYQTGSITDAQVISLIPTVVFWILD